MTAILWALIFLMLGIFEIMAVNRLLYPVLRWRHEKAKLTQSHWIRPDLIINALRFQSLVVMPMLGFLIGNRLGSAP